ncbi:MAG: S8 family serine peptidase, partial [Synergistaceae bacterium]
MKNKKLWIIILASLFISRGIGTADAENIKDKYAEGEVLVTMSGSYSVSVFNLNDTENQTRNITARMNMAAPIGTKTVNTYNNISTGTGKTVALLKSETKTTEELISEMSSKPGVEAVYPNYKRETCDTTPNDSVYGKGIQWGASAAGLTKAWDITTGASDVVVGIIDTGLKYDHRDLAGNVAEVTGLTGTYGSLNNAHGAWFEGSGTRKWKIGDTSNTDISTYDEAKMQGKNASYTDRRFFGDINGHGTHVAGIIGGKGNNGIGIAGAAWNVTLLPVNVFTLGNGKAEDEGAFDSDIVRGLEYLLEVQQNSNYKGRLKVINMSIGGWNNEITKPESHSMAIAMKKLDEAGVIICMAAGNSGANLSRRTGLSIGKQFYPAAFARSANIANAIVVGNARRTDSGKIVINKTSNYSNPCYLDTECYVDIFAPGTEIISTVPRYDATGAVRVRRYSDSNDPLPQQLQTLKDPYDGYEGYQNMSGTSMASPMAAGSAALLCAKYPASEPNEIKNMLLAGADGHILKKAYSLCGMLDVNSSLRYGEPIESPHTSGITGFAEDAKLLVSNGNITCLSYDVACTNAEALGEKEKANS